MPLSVSGKRDGCCSSSAFILESSCASVFSVPIGPCLGKENQRWTHHSNGSMAGGPGGEIGIEEHAPRAEPPGPGKEGWSYCLHCLPLCLCVLSSLHRLLPPLLTRSGSGRGPQGCHLRWLFPGPHPPAPAALFDTLSS